MLHICVLINACCIRSAISNAGPAFAARIQPPDSALLSMWDPRSPGFGAGTHGMGFGKTPGGAYAPGAAAGTVAAKAIKPMKSLDLYIANEAVRLTPMSPSVPNGSL